MTIDIETIISEMFPKVVSLNRTIFSRSLSEHIKGEIFALNVIVISGGASTPGELSSASHTSTARVAVMLNSMERKGYITRRIDPSDRRKVVVEVTQAGRDYANGERERLIVMLGAIIRELGEDDTRELLRILSRLFETIEKVILNENCPKEENN